MDWKPTTKFFFKNKTQGKTEKLLKLALYEVESWDIALGGTFKPSQTMQGRSRSILGERFKVVEHKTPVWIWFVGFFPIDSEMNA